MAKSRTVEAYSNLKLDILNGVHSPGSQLRIDGISKSLNVGLGAVREALSRLTSDGLVTAIPQKGFVVTPVSAKDLIDLTEVRIETETNCLKRSISKGDLAWEGRIISTYHQLSRTPLILSDDMGNVNDEWTRIHHEFHDVLISACDNEWWLKIRNHMFVQAERYRRMSVPYAKTERDVDAEHKEIMDAALARDTTAASKLLAEHLQRTADILLASDTPLNIALMASSEKVEA